MTCLPSLMSLSPVIMEDVQQKIEKDEEKKKERAIKAAEKRRKKDIEEGKVTEDDNDVKNKQEYWSCEKGI